MFNKTQNLTSHFVPHLLSCDALLKQTFRKSLQTKYKPVAQITQQIRQNLQHIEQNVSLIIL